MKKSLSLGIMLLLFFSACSSGGSSGGGSSDPTNNNPTNNNPTGNNPAGAPDPKLSNSNLAAPDSLKWNLYPTPRKDGILSQPVFNGKKFVALGINPTKISTGGSKDWDLYATQEDSTTYSPHTYVSLDGKEWKDTTSGPENLTFIRNLFQEYLLSSQDLVSYGGQAYFLGAYDWMMGGGRASYTLDGDATWQKNAGSFFPRPNLVGPNNNASGPYYTTDSYTSYIFPALPASYYDNKDGQQVTFDTPSTISTQKAEGAPRFTFGKDKQNQDWVFSFMNGWPNNVLSGPTLKSKLYLYRAKLGEASFSSLPSFPGTEESWQGYSGLPRGFGAFGKGSYLAGMDKELQPKRGSFSSYDSTSDGATFYQSADLETWSPVEALNKTLNKPMDATYGSSFYQLGGISFLSDGKSEANDLFVIFINEGQYKRVSRTTYSEDSITTTFYPVYQSTACHILTSKDLKNFQAKKIEGLNCSKDSKAFFLNGRYVFTLGRETGRFITESGEVREDRPLYSLVIVTAEP